MKIESLHRRKGMESMSATLLMYYVSENIFFSPLSISLFTAAAAAVVTNLVLVPKKFQKFYLSHVFHFFSVYCR